MTLHIERDELEHARPGAPPGGGVPVPRRRRAAVVSGAVHLALSGAASVALAYLAGGMGASGRARLDAVVAIVAAVLVAGATVVLAVMARAHTAPEVQRRAVGALAAGTLATGVGVVSLTLDRGRGHTVASLAIVVGGAALALASTLGLALALTRMGGGAPSSPGPAASPPHRPTATRGRGRWLVAGAVAAIGGVVAGFLVADRSAPDVFKDEGWYAEGYRREQPPGTPATYREWVQEAVARYRDDPTILAWQLVNEADPKTSENGTCPDSAAVVLRAFASDMSQLVKSIDSNHLLSVGTIGSGQCGAAGDEYQALHRIEQVDVCEYHDYSPDAMPGDQWNGLARRLEQCGELGKPLFVGEMGVSSGAGLDERAARFDVKLDAQLAAGAAGVLLWRWAPEPAVGASLDIAAGDPALGVLAGQDLDRAPLELEGFVQRSGTQLTIDDVPFRFTGINYYEATGDLYSREPAPSDRLADALPAMGPGVMVVRSWFFQCLATSGGQRDWSSFDATLEAARAAGVRVVATLTDQYHDC